MMTPEDWGRAVRWIWIAAVRARIRNPKPSWVAGFDELDDFQKTADIAIGVGIARLTWLALSSRGAATAVQLTGDHDGEMLAAWTGGELRRRECAVPGEYETELVLPGGAIAVEGDWLIMTPAGVVIVSETVNPRPGVPEPGDGVRQAGPKPALQMLFFVRVALRAREAYLTDAATGGPPVPGSLASSCGWSPVGAARPERSGTWIGCVSDTPEGRRVYLNPDRVLEVVKRLAAPLEVPFPYTRQDLGAALHATGILETEATAGQDQVRWTVRRQFRGYDLPGGGPWRVWDLPAGEVLDDRPGAGPPAATPAGRRQRHDPGPS